jgi:hypothetical protein
MVSRNTHTHTQTRGQDSAAVKSKQGFTEMLRSPHYYPPDMVSSVIESVISIVSAVPYIQKHLSRGIKGAYMRLRQQDVYQCYHGMPGDFLLSDP